MAKSKLKPRCKYCNKILGKYHIKNERTKESFCNSNCADRYAFQLFVEENEEDESKTTNH
ncbi:hypothetical protein [Sulfurovum sp. bin170]|uniref:hypothetical protein n=1 Tax=Sulfurovum sp. bin170 TaxID=2695268 RepID=UPI0013E02040|nr:hypothetical protein [Sulfurovum sp. bin170]